MGFFFEHGMGPDNTVVAGTSKRCSSFYQKTGVNQTKTALPRLRSTFVVGYFSPKSGERVIGDLLLILPKNTRRPNNDKNILRLREIMNEEDFAKVQEASLGKLLKDAIDFERYFN